MRCFGVELHGSKLLGERSKGEKSRIRGVLIVLVYKNIYPYCIRLF